jgi:hypothetical protein
MRMYELWKIAQSGFGPARRIIRVLTNNPG